MGVLPELDGDQTATPGAGGEDAPASGAAGAWLRASADAFDRALIALDDDGARLIAGDGALAACAAAVGEVAAAGDARGLLAALARRDGVVDAGLRALNAAGAPFDAVIRGPGGTIRLSGRAAGALALVALWAADAPSASPRAAALEVILDALAEAAAVFGADRRLCYHNAAFARLWDLDPGWLARGPTQGAWLDRLRQRRRLPEAADYARFKAEELALHDDPARRPEAIWRIAGDRTLRMRALADPGGGLILLFSDLTPELRLKSRLNQLVQVRQATLDKLTDAVAVFGSDARLKLRNEAFQRLWSLPPEALAGEPAFDDIADVCVTRLPDRLFWRTLKGRVADPDPAARAAAAGEARIADGRWLAWRSQPLPDGATLVSFTDITGERRLERALREREGALKLAERLKRDFVGGVSHQLRTPLTTVVGYAELLATAETGLSPRGRDWLRDVRAAAADLARSVEDILTLAEVDAGDLTLTLAPTDVASLLDAAVARSSARAGAHAVELETRLGEDLGVIQADAGALARVLDHLIETALRRAAAGGRVGVAARRTEGEVCLEVGDTGAAIPYHVQAHIFDRFTGQEDAGAGQGLALVKALIEAHGGWVEVESAPPAVGARFACHLPEGGLAPAEGPRPP